MPSLDVSLTCLKSFCQKKIKKKLIREQSTLKIMDFLQSDRVGGRRQRSPESEESSSSDSQNLEYDKMAGNHRKPTYSANIQSLFQLKW